jgi:hypothetical protein
MLGYRYGWHRQVASIRPAGMKREQVTVRVQAYPACAYTGPFILLEGNDSRCLLSLKRVLIILLDHP